eukprot:7646423-Pyramimonas_sp.AAC.1
MHGNITIISIGMVCAARGVVACVQLLTSSRWSGGRNSSQARREMGDCQKRYTVRRRHYNQ